MVPRDSVSVLGQPPFHCTALTSGGSLAYVGGNWERDVAFAGYAIPLAVSGVWMQRAASAERSSCQQHLPAGSQFDTPTPSQQQQQQLWAKGRPNQHACPLGSTRLHATPHCAAQGDISADQMLKSLPGTDPARRQRLFDVLDIDPTWRMHLVSGAWGLMGAAGVRPARGCAGSMDGCGGCAGCTNVWRTHEHVFHAPFLAHNPLPDGQRRRVQIAMGLLKPFQARWAGSEFCMLHAMTSGV